MSQGMRLIVYPVHDLAQAKRLYGTLLGVEPYVDGSYYVGFRVGDQEIGLDPQRSQRWPDRAGKAGTGAVWDQL